jgi:hypothetical protein
MKIEAKENQTLIDLAIQLYGNADSVTRLIALNPQLTESAFEFEVSGVLAQGTEVYFDDVDIDKKILKELDGKSIISE